MAKKPTLRELAAIGERMRAGWSKGGQSRARKLTANELSAIGKQGAATRWAGHTAKTKRRRTP